MGFEELYQNHKQMVYRYIFFLTGNNSLAEELTQETFYQVYLSQKSYQSRCALSTWILAIARRVCLNYFRKRNMCHMEKPDWEDVPAGEKYLPEVALDNKELREKIVNVLQELPETYRSIIIWREMEGRSFEEIATIMDKSPSTIRVILFRAKKRFKALYAKE
ncbi:MAG: RNA polymerase sigma factor [Bacillota bacterium]